MEGASKPVIVEEKAEQTDRGSGMGKAPPHPPPLTFTSPFPHFRLRKTRNGGKKNETVLHRRVELAGCGDIHFNAEYLESRSSQLFCHKHSATQYKYGRGGAVFVFAALSAAFMFSRLPTLNQK